MQKNNLQLCFCKPLEINKKGAKIAPEKMERAVGVEPITSSLGSSRSAN